MTALHLVIKNELDIFGSYLNHENSRGTFLILKCIINDQSSYLSHHVLGNLPGARSRTASLMKRTLRLKVELE